MRTFDFTSIEIEVIETNRQYVVYRILLHYASPRSARNLGVATYAVNFQNNVKSIRGTLNGNTSVRSRRTQNSVSGVIFICLFFFSGPTKFSL